MRRLLLVILIALGAGRASGHGAPIKLTGVEGRIVTDKLVYSSGEFEDLLGVLWTDQPGFGIAQSTDGVSVGAAIGFNVVDRLLYWNGAEVVPSLLTFTIANSVGAEIQIDDDTTFLAAPPVATYSGAAGWHEHVDYLLPSGAAPGAYGLVWQITATGYEKSTEILLVFNLGLPEGEFSEGVTALTETQFHWPGDANGDGLVDGGDFTTWADHFGQPGVFSEGDFNRDGVVDGADFTIWSDNFGHVDPPEALGAVPEPSGLVISGVGACLLFGVLWRSTANRGEALWGGVFSVNSWPREQEIP